MNVLDGVKIAAFYTKKIKNRIDILKSAHNLTAGLAIIRVGDDPASEIYVKRKLEDAEQIGIRACEYHMPANVSIRNILTKIDHLNNDPRTHAIIVQLPLPDHIDVLSVINEIDPKKDVDGFHPINVGGLQIGDKFAFAPCTAIACMKIIASCISEQELVGARALIVGRSNIVGKPLAQLLLKNDATVTIAHSKSRDLDVLVSESEILISAVGRPGLIRGSWIKQSSIVIDVGITRIIAQDGKVKLKGDVEFDEAARRAKYITPVPGGVGPMTRICLIANTINAMTRHHNIEFDDEL